MLMELPVRVFTKIAKSVSAVGLSGLGLALTSTPWKTREAMMNKKKRAGGSNGRGALQLASKKALRKTLRLTSRNKA